MFELSFLFYLRGKKEKKVRKKRKKHAIVSYALQAFIFIGLRPIS